MATKQLDLEPVAGQMEVRQSGPMELLQIALQNNAAIDVIERLAALHEKFEAKAAEDHFNRQMCLVQGKVERVCPDLHNAHTKSKYASYAALNAVIRPVYVEHGFSVSFSEDEGSTPDFVRIVAYVSNGGHTRIYRKSMPVDTAGPKGTQIVNKPQGSAIAESYAKRYLLKDIFNIAIGEDDRDGNSEESPIDAAWSDERDERLAFFPKCSTMQELQDHWKASYEEAKKHKDTQAVDAFNFAKNKRKTELAGAK